MKDLLKHDLVVLDIRTDTDYRIYATTESGRIYLRLVEVARFEGSTPGKGTVIYQLERIDR